MPHRVPDTASVLRQLKLLVIVLIISNIALGGFGFYLLRKIDRNYSILIDQSVPVLNGLQALTASASETMRSTNPVLLTEAKHSPAELANAARAAIAHDGEVRDDLVTRNWVGEAQTERASVRQAGQEFDQLANRMIPLLETNNLVELSRRREAELRPLYNEYVAATSKAAQLLHNRSIETSDNLSLRTGSLSRLLLGFGTWPMILLGVFLVFTAMFVITVLVRVKLLGGADAA